jgi:hypothetical protein
MNKHKFSIADVKIDRFINHPVTLTLNPENTLKSTILKQRKHTAITPNVMGVSTPIDPSVTWRIIGGNVNGLRQYGNMAALITVAERLRALQAETIAFSDTNIEWYKYKLLDNNMQKLFIKAFCAARMEYSTTPDKFETTYHKPGRTVCGVLRQMVHIVVDSGCDDTGCGRWSYITYAAKEGNKVAIFST